MRLRTVLPVPPVPPVPTVLTVLTVRPTSPFRCGVTLRYGFSPRTLGTSVGVLVDTAGTMITSSPFPSPGVATEYWP